MELILASGSPRRQKMLSDYGVEFVVQVPDIDERRLRGEPALNYVSRLAKQKGEAAARSLGLLDEDDHFTLSRDWALLSADTIVVSGKLVLGKPSSPQEAMKFLKLLAGRTHEVITAYCWHGALNRKFSLAEGTVSTNVRFSDPGIDYWKRYIATGEPMDKAGAYGAQDGGMAFIEKISGSYSNVVGLPLPQVLSAFKRSFGKPLYDVSRNG